MAYNKIYSPNGRHAFTHVDAHALENDAIKRVPHAGTFCRNVLDVVVELFWTKGYEATSISDIVEATGLNKSSLYNTFGPKNDLFEAAVERYLDMRTAMMTEVVGDGTAGLDDGADVE